VDIDFYMSRARDFAEPLPWDHIDTGVSKDFLKLEWKRALEEAETPDCRDGECHLCGVCDFDTIKPVTFAAEADVPLGKKRVRISDEGQEGINAFLEKKKTKWSG